MDGLVERHAGLRLRRCLQPGTYQRDHCGASPAQQQPEPEPGEMTRDEAEQLLQWAQDSDEVNRRQAPLRVRCPSKPW